MLVSDLQKLGLTTEEAKIYLVILELGGAGVSTIAKRANVHRVSCYHTLENLIKKGLLSTQIKNRIKYFSSENPEKIVHEQEEKLEKAKALLPQLLSITNALAFKPKIHFYEGIEGIKNIFEDILKSAKNEILGYTNLKSLGELFPDYLKQYNKKKVEKNIKTRFISPYSKEAIQYLEKFYPKNFDRNLVEIIFVNPEEFNFETEISIYGNKVAIMSLDPKESIGVLMESPVLSRTERAVYNLAWLGATSFIAR